MPVPDSGMYAALGYAEESRHSVRARPRPQPLRRPDLHRAASRRSVTSACKVKLNPVREVVEGKRVVLVDDSIVRGTTLAQDRQDDPRGRRARGPRARLFAADDRTPATTASTRPRASELIAANQSVEEIRKFIDADSLGYLSVEGMLDAFGRPQQATCTACFTGIYPVEIEEEEREKEHALDAK